MTHRTPLDRVRDLVDGRLAPAEAEAVRAEIAGDADLRAAFEEFRDVHALTAPAAVVPKCTLEFADLSGGSDVASARSRRLRPVWPWSIAAAALAAVALGAGVSLLRPAEPREVELVLLATPESADALPESAESTELPASLGDFRAAADGKMRWVADYGEGVALARASGLPMLVYIHFPGCPMCSEMDGATFGDGAVQERAAAFVPLRVDVREAPEEYEKRLRKGWPYVAAVDADGEVLEEFPGMRPAPDMAERLAHASAEATKRRVRPDAGAIRAAVASLRRGDEARAAGRLGEAWTAYSDAGSRGAGLVSEVAAKAARALRRDAAAALAKAKEAATSDAGAALRALEPSVRAFAGSPPGDDLAAVAAALRDTGVFPLMKESKR